MAMAVTRQVFLAAPTTFLTPPQLDLEPRKRMYVRYAKILAGCVWTLAVLALPATAAAQAVVMGSGPGDSPLARLFTPMGPE